jgi:ABC-type dipeptide/oligopeptide/nickel transport system permease subunit
VLSAAVAGASGVADRRYRGLCRRRASTPVLMRGTDAMLAVPRLPLLMIAAACSSRPSRCWSC